MPRLAFRLLLGLAAALVLLMGGSLLLPAATAPTARLHPEIPSLLHSTGGLAGQPETLWLGYAMALVMVALLAVCVWIGLRRHDAATPLSRWMMAGFVVYALIFTALTYTYATYAETGTAAFFGGFPLPTAWMIYGVWLFPLVLVGLFTALFDRWVLTDDDLARFEALLAENEQDGGGAA